jgi:hypothetical protein
MKSAKIIKCVWTNKWTNPKGDDVHYHSLTLDNGEELPCGSIEKYPEKLEEGKKIHYEVVKNKIKLVTPEDEDNYPAAKAESEKKKPAAKKSYGKKQEDFLGYCSRYAVDMVIAGKTTKKDIDNAKKITAELYGLHGDLLNPTTPDE